MKIEHTTREYREGRAQKSGEEQLKAQENELSLVTKSELVKDLEREVGKNITAYDTEAVPQILAAIDKAEKEIAQSKATETASTGIVPDKTFGTG
ncbi:MAG: hypothetical protein K0Q74_158 [Gammaproteobacteria bacterium]|jgi:hypothetical protein|nr:hypothetical protein [Gammaproteobacteria bacterium]